MATTGIYSITLEDGRCYVGQSVNIEIRWRNHRTDLHRNVHSSPFLQNAWNKYGERAFTFTILEECEPGALTEREQWWMDNSDSAFNACPAAGSPVGYKHTDETRLKMSESHKGIPRTPEWLANQSDANLGKTMSAESRAKMSASKKGRPGHPHTEEERAQMSAARKGRPGFPPTAETRKKLSITQTAVWERRRQGIK